LTAFNYRNFALAKYLLDRGANPNLANKGGWTPLYLATDNRNIEGGDYPVPKADLDHLDIIRALLDKGADVNALVKDNTLTRTIFTMQWFFEDGATPFIRAAQSSDVALMKLLLKYGADPRIPTSFGDTALTAAGGIGWVEGVTYERSPEENLEAIRMLEEGVASAEDIDRAMELGYNHPMGPLRLTDLVGLDVRLGIAEYLASTLGPRFEPPQLLRELVAEGKLGKKTGQGFYKW
jgi:ankyrin repeat protein